MTLEDLRQHVVSIEKTLMALTKLSTLYRDSSVSADRKSIEIWHLFFEISMESLKAKASQLPDNVRIYIAPNIIQAVEKTKCFRYENQEHRITQIANRALSEKASKFAELFN